MDEDGGQGLDSSQLFLVRLWAGEASQATGASIMVSGARKMQGRVMHVLSGEGSNFDDWSTLLRLLIGMMPPTGNDENGTEDTRATS